MSRQPDPQKSVERLDTKGVLEAETKELWGDAEAAAIWSHPDPVGEYGRRMLRNDQAALCLSGGGIRSAAFALGVVQALARKNLLPGFQYLSTVSGGGYLGSFLWRWIQEKDQDVTRVQAGLEGGGPDCLSEPGPIRWLRDNSNFITPRIGIASADTWTAIAVSARNILINWLVFGPTLLIAIALPYLGAAVLAASGGWLADVYLVTGIALVGFATGMGARVLPSHLGRAKRWSGKSVFRYIVLPGVVGSTALGAGIAPHLPWHEISVEVPASPSIRPEWFKSLSLDPTAQTHILAFTSVFIALIAGYVGGWLGAASESDKDLARSNSRAFLRNAPIWMIGALASAAFYVWGITLLEGVSCNLLAAGSGPCAWQRDVATTFIVSWGILSQLVATVLFVAFRVIPRGEELSPDLDREWLARLSAQKIRMAIAWTLFAAGALLFRHVLVDLLEYVTSSTAAWDWLGGVSGIVGAISGAIAILGGRAANTGYRGNPGSARTLLPFDSVVGLATLFFIIVLLSVIGQIEFKAADWASQLSTPTPLPIVDAHLVVIILAVGVLALTSTHINVNRFSLNGMYRNRLARAFLGAAREKRHDADPFTGFAPSDNIRLHTLRP